MYSELEVEYLLLPMLTIFLGLISIIFNEYISGMTYIGLLLILYVYIFDKIHPPKTYNIIKAIDGEPFCNEYHVCKLCPFNIDDVHLSSIEIYDSGNNSFIYTTINVNCKNLIIEKYTEPSLFLEDYELQRKIKRNR